MSTSPPFAVAGTLCVAMTLCLVLVTRTALADENPQDGFTSQSTGDDGALDLTKVAPKTTLRFPSEVSSRLGRVLDADGDNVYHFTTIKIPQGVTLKLSARERSAPVHWLARGDVEIDGVIDLDGEDGHDHNEPHLNAFPGSGGFLGGIGGLEGLTFQPGSGPGGGASSGQCANHNYGNGYLLPLIGGSGGAGGWFFSGAAGGGGGAGGGAILIASSASIRVEGAIDAKGGTGGTGGGNDSRWHGGGGSGGAIRLLAPRISGAGRLSTQGARGGGGGFCIGANGRVRLEAYENQNTFNGPIVGVWRAVTLTSRSVFLPNTTTSPSLRVTSVAGLPLDPNPTGSFQNPDLCIDESGSVTIEIEARNVPVGAVVELIVLNETSLYQTFNSTPLKGTLELSTASASFTFPNGFTRVQLRVDLNP